VIVAVLLAGGASGGAMHLVTLTTGWVSTKFQGKTARHTKQAINP